MRFPDVAALSIGAAEALAARIASCVADRKRCRLALAGGSSPRPVYERLAAAAGIDWGKVHVFWGDERSVPPDHEASNYGMAQRALLSKVAIPSGNVHRILGEKPPGEAARLYAREVGDEPMDVTLLGMGDDGHTASIFPDTPDLDTAERVVATRSPNPPPDRVSMTLRALSDSRSVLFLVGGASKANRVAEVFDQIASGRRELPAARVAPRGELVWLMDAAAAARLDETQGRTT